MKTPQSLQQQGEDRAKLRRSSRVRQSPAVFSPGNENPIKRCENNKRKHNSLQVENEELELTVNPSGFEMPPAETMDAEPRDAVPVVKLPPFSEKEKPKRDLFLLERATKPRSREKISPEDRQHLVNAASVLKSELVAQLTSSADKLKAEDMIDLANRCYRTLTELGDDYRSFDREVFKLIAQRQELEFAAKDMENRDDPDLRARYDYQVQLMSHVTEELHSAQDKLSITKTHVDSLKFKKDELTSALLLVMEELSQEEEKIETLTAERDKCKEVHFDVEVDLKKLEAERKEASVALEPINARYNAAKEEFERMSNHLLQLVRSSRTG
ncbi:hypothetical protein POM88_001625 [Heracleum sosnowskyi]|uniref:Uncharacterized protein n=1 Tax=Heracleum sosnowskyi TaxID=360622 RepID=A0AAD8JCJ7_9APIA|nr:hypothetical protein POM88_001625 [Heracleum sosnowskyi]